MVARVRQQDAGSEDLVGAVKEQANRLFNVREEAKALKEQAAQKAGELTQSVKEEAEQFLTSQKGLAAARIEKLGSVVHQAARVLEAGNVGKVAEYVDMAAAGAKGAAQYLDESDLGEIADDAADVVRRHPVAAFSAMVLAGLAVARFVKAGQSAQEGGRSGQARAGKRSRNR